MSSVVEMLVLLLLTVLLILAVFDQMALLIPVACGGINLIQSAKQCLKTTDEWDGRGY